MGRLPGLILIVAMLSFIAAFDQADPAQDKGNAVASRPEPPPQPIFGQVVANPTGRNGYEDYVLAADIMIQPKVRDAEDAVYAQPRLLSPLAAKRAWVAAAKRALDLVRAGNAKPIFNPRSKMNGAPLFPEFAGFKQIAKLFTAEARVRFADGDTGGATQSIVDCLTFSDRIGHFVEIGSLVSIACTSIILAEVEADLRVLSQRDAQALAVAADAMLQKPVAMIDGVKGETQLLDSCIDAAIADVTKHVGDQADGSEAAAIWSKFSSELQGLSPSQLRSLKGQVADGIRSRLNGILATLQGPETGWTAGESADQAPVDLRDFLVQIMLPVYGPGMNSAARSRTQLRLLRLHGAIISFLWEWHRLPKQLGELQDPAIIDDPIAGKPFHYEVKGVSSYDLWSDGWGDTGKVELRYRRAAGTGTQDDGPAIP